MNLMELSSDGKVAYLIKPILKVLQEAGGQLEMFRYLNNVLLLI